MNFILVGFLSKLKELAQKNIIIEISMVFKIVHGLLTFPNLQ